MSRLSQLNESPTYAKLSLAADMTLGFRPGRFWRNAEMTCINLLLTYKDSCKANCSYCGLARDRQSEERTFIHVPWPVRSMDKIVERLNGKTIARRTCISMITHARAKEDTLSMTRRLSKETRQPVSILLSSTLTDRAYLIELRNVGAEKIGIAIDAATEELFDRHRGSGVRGPHQWNDYWQRFEEAVEVFGPGQVGSHFISGLGESERDLVRCFQQVRRIGGVNHLFSFFPEPGSGLETLGPPPLDSYRRVQIACHLIDAGLSEYERFQFTEPDGKIADFGVREEILQSVIDSGEPFRTRGCKGCDGEVDCNRPFGNSYPGPHLRNYPFRPDAEDIRRIRRQIEGLAQEEHEPTLVNRKAKKSIVFAAPNMKQYRVNHYSNRGRPNFLATSVTGKGCQLYCDHCQAKLLKPMLDTRKPEELWDLAVRVARQNGEGLLVSGGCLKDGTVPLQPFADTFRRIKSELGLKIAVHSKFVTRALAEALSGTGLDAVMMDVPCSERIIHEIYHLPHYGYENVAQTLDLLEEFQLPAAPHLLLGFGDESNRREGVAVALDLLKGRTLQSLVAVFLMPLPGTPMKRPEPMPLREANAVFKSLRSSFPHTPLYLGCARPPGKYQVKLEMLALKHSFEGIAFPSDETIELAQKRNYEIHFRECCCAISG